MKGWTFDYKPVVHELGHQPQIGPALAEAITCLSRTSGHKVVVVAHSMGGLATRFAVDQRTPDTRQPVSELVAEQAIRRAPGCHRLTSTTPVKTAKAMMLSR